MVFEFFFCAADFVCPEFARFNNGRCTTLIGTCKDVQKRSGLVESWDLKTFYKCCLVLRDFEKI